ncbi:MAG: hypothetical protein ACI4VG_08565 [Lachnospiraceae bacterium]
MIGKITAECRSFVTKEEEPEGKKNALEKNEKCFTYIYFGISLDLAYPSVEV